LDSIAKFINSSVSNRVPCGKEIRVVCPECGPDRKKQGHKTLSVSVRESHALFLCHHCDAKGRVNFGQRHSVHPESRSNKKSNVVHIEDVNTTPSKLPKMDGISDEYIGWMAEHRGISEDTCLKAGLVTAGIWMRGAGAEVSCMGFPYSHSDGSVSVKWRDTDKNFSQTGSAKELWRINEFDGGDLIICEGEMDALSYQEAGVFAVSVPNGAPNKASVGVSSKKYEYLFDARDKINSADRVIIASDSDEPGALLSEEIVRRIGKAKCWVVSYPDGCKDANDVLVKHGVDELRSTLVRATPWPVSGIRDAKEFRESAISLYTDGMDHGVSLGLPDLDKVYRVNPQTLTICTGIPGSGKSSFLTWLSVSLASKTGWGSVILSAETPTEIHVLQMAAIYLGKPFSGEFKMSEAELNIALDWVQSNFTFLDTSDTTIKSVLDRAAISILRTGARIVQIDPYNFLTTAEDGIEGVLQINKLLVGLKQFSEQHDCAVILCAHPTKMYRAPDGSTPSPSGYDVAGSSAFFNIADAGLTVDREEQGKSKITCWKSRFPWIGSVGSCVLEFNPLTGGFSTPLFGSEHGQKKSYKKPEENFDDFDI
jgi:twinkle protein